jgi:hypothetical protein
MQREVDKAVKFRSVTVKRWANCRVRDGRWYTYYKACLCAHMTDVGKRTEREREREREREIERERRYTERERQKERYISLNLTSYLKSDSIKLWTRSVATSLLVPSVQSYKAAATMSQSIHLSQPAIVSACSVTHSSNQEAE